MLQALYETRQNHEEVNDAAVEVDNEVFRTNIYPRLLNKFMTLKGTPSRLVRGQQNLVYRDLLADQIAPQKGAHGDSAASAEVEESSENTDSETKADADPFAPQRPRGKRFEDKDARKDHKKQVKEEKRVQRENKIPKYVKKKMISNSSRNKH
ncbi:serine/threonine-protein kinase RIO1 [Physcia stellaris]|nr:serine/threonine-protein kinase RIO1 [Physcia stellaris]